MRNLKTMLNNKFRESDPPVVFHKPHWSKMFTAVCAMKMEYFVLIYYFEPASVDP